MRFPSASLLLVLVTVGAAGCAVTRAELDIPVKQVANPAAGSAMYIAAVKDSRQFEPNPKQPSIPSLKYGEIHDPSITSRAYALKHKGRGDILLPPGRTVADVVGQTVARAFRERGYRVVPMGTDPGALPVNVDITQFWAWYTPGFSVITVEFNAALQVRVPLGGFGADAPVLGFSKIESKSFVYTPTWTELMTRGLDDLAANLEARIPAP